MGTPVERAGDSGHDGPNMPTDQAQRDICTLRRHRHELLKTLWSEVSKLLVERSREGVAAMTRAFAVKTKRGARRAGNHWTRR
jgi:hypothetical protein